jgi:hypothetical protein
VGSGDPSTCIPDLWAGAGTVGYSGTNGESYRHYVDLQPGPSFVTVVIDEPRGTSREPLNFGVWAAITGNGSAAAAASGCGLSSVAARSTCTGSPAANNGYTPFGYPCFRDRALPVLLLTTDEGPLQGSDTNKCPDWDTVVRPAVIAKSAKLMGILGSDYAAVVRPDLEKMARDTGAIDATNNAPLVFDGANSNSAAAIEAGVRTLANNLPLDMAARAGDDPADAVDAVAAFVDHLETLQLGTAQCANMLNDVDTNADTFDDAYVDVRTGTPVCWKLVPKINETVPATDRPQLYRAKVDVLGDGVTVLDTREVFFLVPPQPIDVPVN